jgi:hypothetical protein
MRRDPVWESGDPSAAARAGNRPSAARTDSMRGCSRSSIWQLLGRADTDAFREVSKLLR